MSLTSFIVRRLVVSSVLLSVLQGSSAVRFSRSMRYPAPPMRTYIHPWKYLPFVPLPRSMQRRFMWKEMDHTVDELMDGVATGARAMTHIFTPSMVRYRKPIDFEPQPSKIKYVVKKPPPGPPTFKRMKVMKFRAPKKPMQIFSPLVDISSAGPPNSVSMPNLILPYMSEEELRKIEKAQEIRVENQDDAGIHEHSHQTHMDADVISGRINEFGEGWLPIQVPYSTPKSFAVSELHTNVASPASPFLPSSPTTSLRSFSSPSSSSSSSSSSSAPSIDYESKNSQSYEVTEFNAEESIQKEQAFKPSNHFDYLGPTTEVPNYPEYFLKSIQKIDEPFRSKRVHAPITTTIPTTRAISTTTLSHRLPPRSTTERPFKRYNLHRPKSSKLFFNRPTSSVEPTKPISTTTTTEQSIRVLPELPPSVPEPIKTTSEPIRTTREPVRKVREPPKVLPEKVRTTRNDAEARSKIRIKNTSQNENLNKILNKHRGTVKFGEKQS